MYVACSSHIFAHFQIEKWCGLFETLGERRLASHLLVGLELLLPLLFPELASSHDKVQALWCGRGSWKESGVHAMECMQHVPLFPWLLLAALGPGALHLC